MKIRIVDEAVYLGHSRGTLRTELLCVLRTAEYKTSDESRASSRSRSPSGYIEYQSSAEDISEESVASKKKPRRGSPGGVSDSRQTGGSPLIPRRSPEFYLWRGVAAELRHRVAARSLALVRLAQVIQGTLRRESGFFVQPSLAVGRRHLQLVDRAVGRPP